MSKAHRGKGILDKPKRGRGACPVSKQTGVKLLYQLEIDGKQVMVSKIGKAMRANAKKSAAAAAPKEEEPVEAQGSGAGASAT
jgi:hypothetical protein